MRLGTVVQDEAGKQMTVQWYDSIKAMCIFQSNNDDGFEYGWFLRVEITIIRE